MKLTRAAIILLFLIAGMLVWTASNFSKLLSAKRSRSVNPSLVGSQISNIPAGTILVRGFNYGYLPGELTVKVGETVKIRLSSDDSPHTFTIDELGVDEEFTWGKDKDISFVAGKKGTFKFYCRVPGHKEGGMVGTLVVE